MQKLPLVLVCDDDSSFHLAVKYTLKGKYECRSAYHTDEALAIIRKYPVDVLLLDIQMRTPDEGLSSIPRFREADPDLAIVMSSAITDFATVREAMLLGATDYIPKDFDIDDLKYTLEKVQERRSLLKRQAQQNFEAVSFQKRHVLVGTSPKIQSLRKIIEKVSQSNANVVITGETGTGKEVVARLLRKTRPDGTLAPFVAVDSSTIQNSTAESALFGHEKGAFTGAERVTKGIFEEAHGGTVYFDEIANMSLENQARLLRVIQEKEVVRLGSSKAISLEFRVICATNKDLDEWVKEGKFKEDLLQRINVLPIHIPSLRERKEDIAILAQHFAEKQSLNRRLAFSSEALQMLQAYTWPGNVRELSNLVAYLATMAEVDEIGVADLPPKFRNAIKSEEHQKTASSELECFYSRIFKVEKEILTQEYSKSEGNISRLALSLGMDRSHLYSKLKEHGIHTSTRRA